MAIVLNSFTKSVTTAGTQVQLSATTLLVYSATIVAKAANTQKIYIGGANVDNTYGALSAGNGIGIGDVEKNGHDDYVDLSKIWIDSDVNGEGVNVFYSLEG